MTTVQSTAVATQQPATFRDLITNDGYKKQLAAALPKGLTADRMVRVVLTAINRQPKLMDCTKESLWQSVLDSASLGLFPDALGRAYLVPYGKKCQLIIGYKGLIDLMYRSDRISMIQTGVVHTGDHWIYERGLDPKLEHRPIDNPGKWTHVYTIVHLKGCDRPSVEVMTRAEVMAVKARSASASSGPWVTDEEAMAIKTCIRRHSKVLPMSAEMAQAMEMDGDHLDLNAVAKSSPAVNGDDIAAKTTDTTAEVVHDVGDIQAKA
jgi:recombination protein RecT